MQYVAAALWSINERLRGPGDGRGADSPRGVDLPPFDFGPALSEMFEWASEENEKFEWELARMEHERAQMGQETIRGI